MFLFFFFFLCIPFYGSYCITNNRRFPSGEKNAYTQKSFHLTRSKKKKKTAVTLRFSDSDATAVLWQQTGEQHKIPQNNCACLHKLKKRRWHSVWKQVTWSRKYIDGLKEERTSVQIPVERMLVHAGSESEECWDSGACGYISLTSRNTGATQGQGQNHTPQATHVQSHQNSLLSLLHSLLDFSLLLLHSHSNNTYKHTHGINHMSFELSRLVCTWL